MRRWKAARDFGDDPKTRDVKLAALRERLQENDGQSVRTFVADHWTFEYDLAISGLAEEVFVAAYLAKNDNPLNADKKRREDVVADAETAFAALEAMTYGNREDLCSRVYGQFHSGGASKAVAAQYLAEMLSEAINNGDLDEAALRDLLPTYLGNAFTHVTSQSQQPLPHIGISGDADG